MRLHFNDDAGEQVLAEQAESIAAELQQHAVRIAGRLRPPATSDLTVFAGAGIGPRGPYAQAGMRGRGAVAIEFGSRNAPPQAPVRRALGGG
ncbi:MAG: hypothetical protein WDA20_14200 [Desulfuromonadales bacterium]